MPVSKSVNAPVYTSSHSVSIAKLPSDISFNILPESLMITLILSDIADTPDTSSLISSSDSTVGSGESMSPSANVINLSFNSFNGFSMLFDIATERLFE